MGGRTRRNSIAPTRLSAEHLRVLRAVAAGDVWRDDCGGMRRGMWALYRLADGEVGMTVRTLSRFGLLHKPLVGPPRITPGGIGRLEG